LEKNERILKDFGAKFKELLQSFGLGMVAQTYNSSYLEYRDSRILV
jgi:hypothetical protein